MSIFNNIYTTFWSSFFSLSYGLASDALPCTTYRVLRTAGGGENLDLSLSSDKLQETKIKLESKGTTGAILSLNKSFVNKECKAFKS